MIHQHYDPQQILWFLRNYWKFTRDGMIQEWHKTFSDPGFGKSQYQWLKSRYGMKAEWGASLNHPPYPGARPGGSGTEMYEPPNVPHQPPRVTFRARTDSDSPVPTLVSENGESSLATIPSMRGGRRVSGGAASQNFGSSGFLSGRSSTMMRTPMETPHMVAPSIANSGGHGSYTFNNNNNNNNRTTSSGSVNGANGTYSFDLMGSSSGGGGGHGGLGSPFTSNSMSPGNVIADSSINALMARHAMSHYPPTASLAAGSVPAQYSFAGQAGFPDDQMASYQYQLLTSSYPFTANLEFHNLGGDFCHSGPLNLFAGDNGASTAHAGLGINNNPGHQYMSSSAPAVSGATPMLSVAKSNGTVADSAAASSPTVTIKQTETVKSDAGDSAGKGMAELVVSPRGQFAPVARSASKRKRTRVDVSCQPPKRQVLLDPALQAVAGDGKANTGMIEAAELPPADEQDESSELATKKRKRKKSASSSAAETSFASPLCGSAMSPGGASDWHDGPHDDCLFNVRHQHQEGGNFLAQPNDAAAEAMSHNTSKSADLSQPQMRSTAATTAVAAAAPTRLATSAASAAPYVASPSFFQVFNMHSGGQELPFLFQEKKGAVDHSIQGLTGSGKAADLSIGGGGDNDARGASAAEAPTANSSLASTSENSMLCNSTERTAFVSPQPADADFSMFWNTAAGAVATADGTAPATAAASAASATTTLSPLFSSSPPESLTAACAMGRGPDTTAAEGTESTESIESTESNENYFGTLPPTASHPPPGSECNNAIDRLLFGSAGTSADASLSGGNRETAGALAVGTFATSTVDAAVGSKQSPPPPTAGVAGHDDLLIGAELPNAFWDLNFPDV